MSSTNLRQLLSKLIERGTKEWEKDKRVSELGCPFPTEAQLKALMKQSGECFELPNRSIIPTKRLVFPLPRSDASPDWLPLVAVKWREIVDEGRTPARALRLYLVKLHGRNEEDTLYRVHTTRYDEREFGGSHDFAHSQFCDEMRPYDDIFARADPWFSGTVPRVPLPVREADAGGLLIAMLVGFYGRGFDAKLTLAHTELSVGGRKLLAAIDGRA